MKTYPHQYTEPLRPPDGDSAYLKHLYRSPWNKDSCTCRTLGSGQKIYTCQRHACDGFAKACGGYCSSCFTELRSRAGRPEVVVLCGSTRFYEAFQQANYELTMEGKIVLSVGFYPHSKAEHGHGEGVGHDSAEKVALDELHKRKIDMADRVLVLNVGGYIGDSTRSEIDHAVWAEKPIDYIEPVTVEVES